MHFITIKYGNSPSKFYRKVRDNCCVFTDFYPIETSPEGKNILALDPDELIDEFMKFSVIIEHVKKWKATEFYVNGKNTTIYYINKICDVVSCFRQRCIETHKQLYCLKFRSSHGWSCRFLDAIDRYYKDRSDKQWYYFGHFGGDWIWHIDKDRIRNLLDAQIKTYQLDTACPVFSRENVYQLIDKLPDTINPRIDERFKYAFAGSITGFPGDGEPCGIESAIRIMRHDEYFPITPNPDPIIEITMSDLYKEVYDDLGWEFE